MRLSEGELGADSDKDEFESSLLSRDKKDKRENEKMVIRMCMRIYIVRIND